MWKEQLKKPVPIFKDQIRTFHRGNQQADMPGISLFLKIHKILMIHFNLRVVFTLSFFMW